MSERENEHAKEDANEPLISCIIPVLNGERFIGEAIASILSQTHRNIEIIVIDDGSTDGTETVVRVAAPHAHFERQAHAGPVAARNRAIAMAKGEFIALLDADDRWLPNKIELQLREFGRAPETDCVLVTMRLFWDGLESEQAAYELNNKKEIPGVANSTMLVRKAVFDKVGLFRAELQHTAVAEWFERAAAVGIAPKMLPDMLAERRMHRDNFSRQQRAISHDEFLHLVKRSMDRKRANPPSE